MKKYKLTVVVSAYNEEKKLGDCLESVKDLASEIIVVDNNSTDATEKIAKKYTSKIFKRENNLMLNVNKNYGISKATGDFILYLDADERVPGELEGEIRSLLSLEELADGYLIPRKNIIFGKWIQNSIWWPDYQLRLFKNGKGKYAEKHVHELIEVEGDVEKLQNPLLHLNYESVSQYLHKMDHIYTENEAKRILEKGERLTWVSSLRFPVQDFLKTFFSQKGYKDGLHGLVLSLLQAFYSEVVFLKVWEKQGFPDDTSSSFLKDVTAEFKKIQKEFLYWILTSKIEESESKPKKFTLRLLRKLNKITSH